MSITITDAAIALDLPVFPCAKSKAPAIGKRFNGNGFLDASRDPSTIRVLFGHRNAHLIGVQTGPASGFDVLDTDPRHGADDWMALHGHKLPRTRTHATGSGGRHFCFTHHPGVGNSESRIGPGIDTRGDGGYVIWWPAHHCAVLDDAPIAPWPDWLLRPGLALPPPEPPPLPAGAPRAPYNANLAQQMVERALSRVAAAPAGQRHYQLRAAACTIGGLLDPAGLPKERVARDLLNAVIDAGGSDVDRKNAEATIRWGLERGGRSPLEQAAKADTATGAKRPPDVRRKRLARLTFRCLRAGAAPHDVLDQLHAGNRLLAAPMHPGELEQLLIWCVQRHAEPPHAR